MSILVGATTRVVVQGLTGTEGTFHARRMIEYGTEVVGRRDPGQGRHAPLDRPVFDTVAEAVRSDRRQRFGHLRSRPFAAADAILEAAAAGLELVVCITEGIPALDMIKVKAVLPRHVGPPCRTEHARDHFAGGRSKVGIMPGAIHRPGPVGVVSRSGTLTYEAVHQLTRLGLGQSTAVGIGGDPIVGLSFIDLLRLFEEDAGTEAVVLIGEIGGSAEEEAADTHPEGLFQAGRGLHRRGDRPGRAASGTRRGHHVRWPGHGRPQDRSPRIGGRPRGPQPGPDRGSRGRGPVRQDLRPACPRRP